MKKMYNMAQNIHRFFVGVSAPVIAIEEIFRKNNIL